MTRFHFLLAFAVAGALLLASACEIKEEIGSQPDASVLDAAAPAGADASPPGADASAGLDAAPRDASAPVDAASPDASASPDSGTGNIEIYVVGDPTPKVFTDGFSGQTPSPNTIGLSRFDLMTSASDPSPVVVFDISPQWKAMDMLGRTLAGVGSTDAIPPATYTFGRVLLTMSQFTIDASVHSGAITAPGKVTITSALADCTIEGTAWTKGQARYDVSAGGLQQSSPGTLPPLPTTAGGTVVEEAGKTWLVFPMSPPFVIAAGDKSLHKVAIVYDVYQSFRWEDQALTGYAAGVFDMDAVARSFEPVKNFGATGYHIVVEQ